MRNFVRTLICAAVMATTLLPPVAPGAGAADGIERAGDVAAAVVVAAAGGMTLGLWDLEGMKQLGSSATVTLGSTLALKYGVDERRPNGGDHSFPSLHASVAFAAAEYLRARYGWTYGIPAYGLASFVAYSRVDSRNHYVHDVIAGAALGIGCSYFFTTPQGSAGVQPEAGPGYLGIRYTRVW